MEVELNANQPVSCQPPLPILAALGQAANSAGKITLRSLYEYLEKEVPAAFKVSLL
jgi:hypothetical protein